MRQVGLPVVYDGQKIDVGYRHDLLVEGRMVVQVKAVDKLAEMTSASSAILRDLKRK
jgi:GxxExxY protein